tara:strand:- start:1086 stop:1250 length:165 start_codon:yes stop_codon:yes gene_type:complete
MNYIKLKVINLNLSLKYLKKNLLFSKGIEIIKTIYKHTDMDFNLKYYWIKIPTL